LRIFKHANANLVVRRKCINVVLTQPKSVARAEWLDITTSIATIKSRFIHISPRCVMLIM
jgi:hypothetical protein